MIKISKSNKTIICLTTILILSLIVLELSTGVFYSYADSKLDTVDNSSEMSLIENDLDNADSSNEIISKDYAQMLFEKIQDDGYNVPSSDTNYSIRKDANGKVTIMNNITKEYTSFAINDSDNNQILIIYESLECITGNYYLIKDKITVQRHDASEFNNYSSELQSSALAASSIKWESKVKETYKNQYWYQLGYTKSTDYMKIGCKASYRINLSKLSSTRKGRCTDYRKDVASCESHYNSFKKWATGTRLGLEAVIALILINIAYPPSVIVDVLLAAIPGATASAATNAVNNYLTARKKYSSAKSTYETIKEWGTKL